MFKAYQSPASCHPAVFSALFIILFLATLIISSLSSMSSVIFVSAQAGPSYTSCGGDGKNLILEDRLFTANPTFASSLSGCNIVIRNSRVDTGQTVVFDPLVNINITIENLNCSEIGTTVQSCVEFSSLENVGKINISNVFRSPSTTADFPNQAQERIINVIKFSGEITNVNDTIAIDGVHLRNFESLMTSAGEQTTVRVLWFSSSAISALDPSNNVFYTYPQNGQQAVQKLPFPKFRVSNVDVMYTTKILSEGDIQISAVYVNSAVSNFASVMFENISLKEYDEASAGVVVTCTGGNAVLSALHLAESITGICDYLIQKRRAAWLQHLTQSSFSPSSLSSSDNQLTHMQQFLEQIRMSSSSSSSFSLSSIASYALTFRNLSVSGTNVMVSQEAKIAVIEFDLTLPSRQSGFQHIIADGLEIRRFTRIASNLNSVNLNIFNPSGVVGAANQKIMNASLGSNYNSDLSATVESNLIINNIKIIGRVDRSARMRIELLSPPRRGLIVPISISRRIQFFTNVFISGVEVNYIELSPLLSLDFFIIFFPETLEAFEGAAPILESLISSSGSPTINGRVLPRTSFLISNISVIDVSSATGSATPVDRLFSIVRFVKPAISSTADPSSIVRLAGFEQVSIVNIIVNRFELATAQVSNGYIGCALFNLTDLPMIVGGRQLLDSSDRTTRVHNFNSVGSFTVSNISLNAISLGAEFRVEFDVIAFPAEAPPTNFQTFLLDHIQLTSSSVTCTSIANTADVAGASSRIVVFPKGVIGVDYSSVGVFYATSSFFTISNINVDNFTAQDERVEASLQFVVLDNFVRGFFSVLIDNLFITNSQVISNNLAVSLVDFITLNSVDGAGFSFPTKVIDAIGNVDLTFLPTLPLQPSVLIRNISAKGIVMKSSMSACRMFCFNVRSSINFQNYDVIRFENFVFDNIIMSAGNANEAEVIPIKLKGNVLIKAAGSSSGNNHRPGTLFLVDNIRIQHFNITNKATAKSTLFQNEVGIENFERVQISNLVRSDGILENKWDCDQGQPAFVNYVHCHIEMPITATESITIFNIISSNVVFASEHSTVQTDLLFISSNLEAKESIVIRNISATGIIHKVVDSGPICFDTRVLQSEVIAVRVDGTIRCSANPNTRITSPACSLLIQDISLKQILIADDRLALSEKIVALLQFKANGPQEMSKIIFQRFTIDGVDLGTSYRGENEVAFKVRSIVASSIPQLLAPFIPSRFSPTEFAISDVTHRNITVSLLNDTTLIKSSFDFIAVSLPLSVERFSRITLSNIHVSNISVNVSAMLDNTESRNLRAVSLSQLVGISTETLFASSLDSSFVNDAVDAPTLTISNVTLSGCSVTLCDFSYLAMPNRAISALQFSDNVLSFTDIVIEDVIVQDTTWRATGNQSRSADLKIGALPSIIVVDLKAGANSSSSLLTGSAVPWMINRPSSQQPRGAKMSITRIRLLRCKLQFDASTDSSFKLDQKFGFQTSRMVAANVFGSNKRDILNFSDVILSDFEINQVDLLQRDPDLITDPSSLASEEVFVGSSSITNIHLNSLLRGSLRSSSILQVPPLLSAATSFTVTNLKILNSYAEASSSSSRNDHPIIFINFLIGKFGILTFPEVPSVSDNGFDFFEKIDFSHFTIRAATASPIGVSLDTDKQKEIYFSNFNHNGGRNLSHVVELSIQDMLVDDVKSLASQSDHRGLYLSPVDFGFVSINANTSSLERNTATIKNVRVINCVQKCESSGQTRVIGVRFGNSVSGFSTFTILHVSMSRNNFTHVPQAPSTDSRRIALQCVSFDQPLAADGGTNDEAFSGATITTTTTSTLTLTDLVFSNNFIVFSSQRTTSIVMYNVYLNVKISSFSSISFTNIVLHNTTVTIPDLSLSLSPSASSSPKLFNIMWPTPADASADRSVSAMTSSSSPNPETSLIIFSNLSVTELVMMSRNPSLSPIYDPETEWMIGNLRPSFDGIINFTSIVIEKLMIDGVFSARLRESKHAYIRNVMLPPTFTVNGLPDSSSSSSTSSLLSVLRFSDVTLRNIQNVQVNLIASLGNIEQEETSTLSSSSTLLQISNFVTIIFENFLVEDVFIVSTLNAGGGGTAKSTVRITQVRFPDVTQSSFIQMSQPQNDNEYSSSVTMKNFMIRDSIIKSQDVASKTRSSSGGVLGDCLLTSVISFSLEHGALSNSEGIKDASKFLMDNCTIENIQVAVKFAGFVVSNLYSPLTNKIIHRTTPIQVPISFSGSEKEVYERNSLQLSRFSIKSVSTIKDESRDDKDHSIVANILVGYSFYQFNPTAPTITTIEGYLRVLVTQMLVENIHIFFATSASWQTVYPVAVDSVNLASVFVRGPARASQFRASTPANLPAIFEVSDIIIRKVHFESLESSTEVIGFRFVRNRVESFHHVRVLSVLLDQINVRFKDEVTVSSVSLHNPPTGNTVESIQAPLSSPNASIIRSSLTFRNFAVLNSNVTRTDPPSGSSQRLTITMLSTFDDGKLEHVDDVLFANFLLKNFTLEKTAQSSSSIISYLGSWRFMGTSSADSFIKFHNFTTTELNHYDFSTSTSSTVVLSSVLGGLIIANFSHVEYSLFELSDSPFITAHGVAVVHCISDIPELLSGIDEYGALADPSFQSSSPDRTTPRSSLIVRDIRIKNIGSPSSFVVSTASDVDVSCFVYRKSIQKFDFVQIDSLLVQNVFVSSPQTNTFVKGINGVGNIIGSPSTSSSCGAEFYRRGAGQLLSITNILISNVVSRAMNILQVLGVRIHQDTSSNILISNFQSIIIQNIVISNVHAIQLQSVFVGADPFWFAPVYMQYLPVSAITCVDPKNNNNVTNFIATRFQVSNLLLTNSYFSANSVTAYVGGFVAIGQPAADSPMKDFSNISFMNITIKNNQLVQNNIVSRYIGLELTAVRCGAPDTSLLTWIVQRRGLPESEFPPWTINTHIVVSDLNLINNTLESSTDVTIRGVSFTANMKNYNFVTIQKISIHKLVTRKPTTAASSDLFLFDATLQVIAVYLGNDITALVPLADDEYDETRPNTFQVTSIWLSGLDVVSAAMEIETMRFVGSTILIGYQKILVDDHSIIDCPNIETRQTFAIVRVMMFPGGVDANNTENSFWKGGPRTITFSNIVARNLTARLLNGYLIIQLLHINNAHVNQQAYHQWHFFDDVLFRNFSISRVHVILGDRNISSVANSTSNTFSAIELIGSSPPMRGERSLIIDNLVVANNMWTRYVGTVPNTISFGQTLVNVASSLQGFIEVHFSNIIFINNTIDSLFSTVPVSNVPTILFLRMNDDVKFFNFYNILVELPKSSSSLSSAPLNNFLSVLNYADRTHPVSFSSSTNTTIRNVTILDPAAASRYSSSSSASSLWYLPSSHLAKLGREAETLTSSSSSSTCDPRNCALLNLAASASVTGKFFIENNRILSAGGVSLATAVGVNAFTTDDVVNVQLYFKSNNILTNITSSSVASLPIITVPLPATSGDKYNFNGITIRADCNNWTSGSQKQFYQDVLAQDNVKLQIECHPTPSTSVSISHSLSDKSLTESFHNTTKTEPRTRGTVSDSGNTSEHTSSVSHPLPPPTLVMDAISSQVMALGIALTALSGGANSMNARKIMAISSLADCGKEEITDSDIPPVEPDSNPLFIRFGSSRFNTHRGAIMGAVAFTILWLMLMCLIGWVRAVVEHSSLTPSLKNVKRSLRKVGFPGVASVSVFALCPASVNAASAMAKRYHPDEKIDIAIIIFAFLTSALLPLLALVWVVREVRAHEVLKPSCDADNDDDGDDVDGNLLLGESTEKKVETKSSQNNNKRSRQEVTRKIFDDGEEEPLWKYWFDWLTEPKREYRRSKFRDAYGPVFDGFTDPIFLLIGFILVLAAEIIEGRTSLCDKGDRACCETGLHVMMAVSALDFANIVFFSVKSRAYVFLVRSDAVCVTICCVISLVNAALVFIMYQIDGAEDHTDLLITLTEIAFYVSMSGAGLAVLNEIVGACFEIRTVLNMRRRQKELEDFENEHRQFLRIPLMEMMMESKRNTSSAVKNENKNDKKLNNNNDKQDTKSRKKQNDRARNDGEDDESLFKELEAQLGNREIQNKRKSENQHHKNINGYQADEVKPSKSVSNNSESKSKSTDNKKSMTNSNSKQHRQYNDTVLNERQRATSDNNKIKPEKKGDEKHHRQRPEEAAAQLSKRNITSESSDKRHHKRHHDRPVIDPSSL